MLKLFLGLFFISTLLNATLSEKNCKTDLNNMIHLYSKAQRAYFEKNYKKAINEFEASSKASYSALESCDSNYDFNIMYNYIIESENSIYKIQEDIAHL